MNKKNRPFHPKLVFLKKRIHALERPLQSVIVAGNQESGGSGNSNGTVCTHWPPQVANDTVCQHWPV